MTYPAAVATGCPDPATPRPRDPATVVPLHLIGIDCGAESGRVVLGTWDGRAMTMTVVHRFPTPVVDHGGYRCWDLPAMQHGIATGIRHAVQQAGGHIAAIGVDTWGVDFGLVDAYGTLLHPPVCYRDGRTAGMVEAVRAVVTDDELFARTGCAALPFNTIYQLMATCRQQGDLVQRAARLLTMPDLLHQWLCGRAVNEFTNAGTTGLTQAGGKQWDGDLMERLGLPARLLGAPTLPGTVLGPVREELARRFGLTGDTLVVLPPGHDTAAAVAALPTSAPDAVYLSSGTWSLLGAVIDQPLTSSAVRAAGFSNELAADGRVRLNRNIMGLWVVQQCRAAFQAAGRDQDYATLTAAAEAAPSPAVPLDVDDPRFFPPGSANDPMPVRVQAWYRERQLPVPESDGAIVRACLVGLAAAYARARRDLAGLLGRPVGDLFVLGGGGRNRLLARLTAAACGCRVVTGPDEATVLGNLLVQLIGLGHLTWAGLPDAVCASTAIECIAPAASGAA